MYGACDGVAILLLLGRRPRHLAIRGGVIESYRVDVQVLEAT